MSYQPGGIVSVKVTIAAVRKLDPDLSETDCELVRMIVEGATETALFVAFDVRDAVLRGRD
ncbi:hypothetical protein [Mesorhizobium sp. NFR06]|uniref:hypothetical protein n=1 Tax=Mesorhizobium sp. NFR06 TaxID=1566290 RepID=UPI001FCED434|nr:hypothetical protein [Mesorhizobium sp. NFR06]